MDSPIKNTVIPETVEVDPTSERQSLYKIISGCIVPRPIGFISTVSRNGIHNAAPFSFFNGISDVPPMVCVSICTDILSGGQKDTLVNIMDTREFVANIVSEGIVDAQDRCAAPYPPDVDEIRLSGLTALPSRLIGAPRIQESPANFECRLVQSIALPESSYTLVIGQVVYIHLWKEIISEEGRIDPLKLRAVARMGGFTYARTRDLFSIEQNIPNVAARGAGTSECR